MNISTTYTALDTYGDPIKRGLTATGAMIEILTYDSQTYEILQDKDSNSWALWSGDRNHPLVETAISVNAETALEAESLIALDVIRRACEWDGSATAITDEHYAAGLAEFTRQEAEDGAWSATNTVVPPSPPESANTTKTARTATDRRMRERRRIPAKAPTPPRS